MSSFEYFCRILKSSCVAVPAMWVTFLNVARMYTHLCHEATRVDHLVRVVSAFLSHRYLVCSLASRLGRDKSTSDRGGGARRFREIRLPRIPSRSSRSRRYRDVRIWIIEGSIRGSIRSGRSDIFSLEARQSGVPRAKRMVSGISWINWRWSVQTDEVTEIKSIEWRQKLILFSGDHARVNTRGVDVPLSAARADHPAIEPM